ncbi:MAG: HAD-IA family hydrolase [Asgard group archaeon]|nr:HAD-IA family hydrolase [Asgard group archaeon]
MSHKKLLIFDFDNTIITSHIDFPTLKVDLARKVKQLGLDFGPEEEIPHKYTAGEIIEEVEKIDQENGSNHAYNLWELVEEYERKGMENIGIDSCVKETLNYLEQKNYLLSLFTNNAKKPTLDVLKRFNILTYFKLIIAREDISKMKPSPEGIFHILEETKIPPKDAVFIGDSWVDGVAALKAGIRFVNLREKPLSIEKHPDLKVWKHIESFSELKDIF